MFQVARKRRCMSRNKYLLSLASSNYAMEKFFNVELVDFLEVNNRRGETRSILHAILSGS